MTQRRVPAILPAEVRALRVGLGLTRNQLAERLEVSAKTIYRWELGEIAPKRVIAEALRRLAEPRTPPRADQPRFRFVDLFAGIGGMRLAFEALGGECVFTCEWDPYCQKTYRANFHVDHPLASDIRDVKPAHIPPHDILLAGFPCQPFSIAGVSKKNSLGRPHGFACEAQGTLFFDLAKIIDELRPRAFLLENVKNLRSHDGGRTFNVIMDVLRSQLGYETHVRTIDARGFVPQHRERVFIVGFREPTTFSFDEIVLPPADRGPRLGQIFHPEDGSETPEPPYTDEHGRVSRRYVLSGHLWRYLRKYAERHRRKGNGFGFGLVGTSDVARTLSARYHKDGSEILVKRGRGNPRRLTPRECARLMGFDLAGRPPFRIPVSDTRAYRQFGNAVVVPVVQAVARHMLPHVLGDAMPHGQLFFPQLAAMR